MLRHLKNLSFLFVLALWGLMPACQKKCQQAGERLQTIIDKEFRLVQSNDPQVKDLTKTNFLIMVFRINFTGEVFRVENNDRYDNAVLTFKYNIDPERKLIRVQYYKPAGEEAEGAEVGEAQGKVHTYKYDLTNELKLNEGGMSYRYVPFEGVVKPDEVCEF